MNPNDNQEPNSIPTQPTPEAQPLPAAMPETPENLTPPVPQPSTPAFQPANSGSSKKKMLIIGGSILVLLLLAGAVAFLIPKGDDASNNTANSNTTGSSSKVTDRSDGTLVLEGLVNWEDSLKDEDVKLKVGQQVDLSDGFSLMVSSVKTIASYQKTSLGKAVTVKPESGKEFVEVTYVVGSRLEGEKLNFSSSSFAVKDSDGDTEYRSEFFLSTDPLMPQKYYRLGASTLEPGKQQTFVLYYEVPKASSLYAQYSKKYKKYSPVQTVEVKAEVDLR